MPSESGNWKEHMVSICTQISLAEAFQFSLCLVSLDEEDQKEL